MTDCSCRDDTESESGEETSTPDRLITDEPVLEAELPEELQSRLGEFLGTDSVGTLGEWAAEVRRHVGDDSITLEELCLTGTESDHWGTVGDERYHFACFYDAVILAALTDRPVDIRTKSPSGTVIEARAVGTEELTVTPEEAVFSFGIDDDVEPPGGTESPSLEAGYAAICPYVKAFPTPSAYRQWETQCGAETVALPLEGATALAAQLVE
ncbi:alkylmercury lyase family protein [Halobacteria archaeon AArc-curdl1]|uniref:Alkylmercury lyase family protein n=1 Tax=Natronosalvus hydrolyticus TaxID=2979988 RepID=A0AAP2Z882_9EURY|nr:alkylmercury lyase family protein [Halobacteria archaeon AArc-curdl1]